MTILYPICRAFVRLNKMLNVKKVKGRLNENLYPFLIHLAVRLVNAQHFSECVV